MSVVQERLQAARDSELAAIAAHLSDGIMAPRRCVSSVVECYAADVRSAAAGAVPLLKLFGIVAGGWQIARAALVAHERLGQSAGDVAFLRAKVLTARFCADHVLMQAPALAETVTGGATAVRDYPDDRF